MTPFTTDDYRTIFEFMKRVSVQGLEAVPFVNVMGKLEKAIQPEQPVIEPEAPPPKRKLAAVEPKGAA